MIKAGIYIHVPFCNHKCNYCDYYSVEKDNDDLHFFTLSLIKEIELVAKSHDKEWIFDTIYFGGGSPGLLENNDLDIILNKLYKNFKISNNPEITIEINPKENSYMDLKTYKKMGINRLSIGFQSLNSKLLLLLTRKHLKKDCFKTYENAINAGFKNISVDLLYNIPGQKYKEWMADLKSIIQLNPNHITIISLILESETILHSSLQKISELQPNNEFEETMFRKGSNELHNAGYFQYEIGHFSKPEMECKHNLHYWDLNPYLGFGPSAHSYNGIKRWWNTDSIKEYINYISNKESPISNSELLTKINRYNEVIINGFKTSKGISIKNIGDFYSKHSFQKALEKWEKYLNISNDQIIIKTENFYLTDLVTSDFIIENHSL